jgi:hypothetical protein
MKNKKKKRNKIRECVSVNVSVSVWFGFLIRLLYTLFKKGEEKRTPAFKKYSGS